MFGLVNINMANPPPPYDDITGISRAVMKDNSQITLAQYNGNARPGELVVNLETNPPALYVGNNVGQLTLITGGGGGGGLPLANGTSNLDIATINGNVTITVADTNTWTFSTNGDLIVPGTITSTSDTDITAEDDVNISGGNKTLGSASAEGGDVVIFGGTGRIDNGTSTGTGGDVRMLGGDGGDSTISGAGTGGYAEVQGGNGGAGNDANSIQAGEGGYVLIKGGSAGTNDGNLSLSGIGGNVDIFGGIGSFDDANSVPYGAPGHINLYGGNWGWVTPSGNVYLNTYDGTNTKTLTFDNAGNVTMANGGQLRFANGDGVMGRQGDDLVISWDNEELRLVSVGGDVSVEADNDFVVQTNFTGGDYSHKWIFAQNNEIVNITGNSAVVTEAGGLNLQAGRDTLSSGNVTITAVNTGVAINTWTFNNTGVMTMPGPAQLAVYANATVRDSSITSPQPGMMIYVTGTGMQVRGATSWNTIAGSGT